MNLHISAYLSPIIAKNSYHAHRHCFVHTAAQGLAIKGKNKRDILFTGAVDNVVQSLIQPTWGRQQN